MAPDSGLRVMADLGTRFAFASGGSYVQLWSSDGTAAGTRLLLGFDSERTPLLAGVGGKAHLLIPCGNECVTSYFVSDGLPGGIREVVLPGLIGAYESFLANIGDRAAAFACGRVRDERQVCVVDRDGERAAFLSDLLPGFEAGGPQFVARMPDGLYVALDDGRHGTELWRLRELSDAIFAHGFEAPPP